MRQTTQRPLLLALALAASLPTAARADGPGPEPARPAAGKVAVYRGGEANVPPAVPVLRGSSAMGLPAVPAQRPRAAEAVGGDRLWLVDPAGGELVACRLGATTQVGRDRIRCARGGLP